MRTRARVHKAFLHCVASRRGLAREIVRQYGSPRLWDLYESAASWDLDEANFIRRLSAEAKAEFIGAVAQEAHEVLRSLDAYAATTDLPYQDHMGAGNMLSIALYAVVRTRRPAQIIETGVANGRSTAMMLAALDANGDGVLHSIDIARDVGALVRDRSRWHLHIIDPTRRSDFERVVSDVKCLDLFLHDSDHTYEPQLHEYRIAWEALRKGGLLVSDDIDWSYAFLDFQKEVEEAPHMLFDYRKVVGALTRSGNNS